MWNVLRELCVVILAEETIVRRQLPFRGVQKLQRHLCEVRASELEHSETASGAMERSARDLEPMDLELLRNLVRSETRPTSEASSRHPSQTASEGLFR